MRQNLAEEEELLVSLAAEVTANLDSLANTTRIVTQVREATLQLARTTPEELGLLGDAEAHEMLRRLTGASSFHPADGVRQAVVATGSLSLLRSRELRAALGGLQGLHADAEEEVVRDFMLRDVIIQSMPPGTVTAMQLIQEGGDGDTSLTAALAQIRRDSSLVDQMAWRRAIQWRYLAELESLRQEYVRILALIARSSGQEAPTSAS